MWLWHRSSNWWMNSTPTGIERLYPWLDTLTVVLNHPGWLVVMFKISGTRKTITNRWWSLDLVSPELLTLTLLRKIMLVLYASLGVLFHSPHDPGYWWKGGPSVEKNCVLQGRSQIGCTKHSVLNNAASSCNAT